MLMSEQYHFSSYTGNYFSRFNLLLLDSNIVRMEFNERVKAARLHAGLSQEALAEKVGLTQKAISKMESKIAQGSTHTVQIAVVCGVRPEWLGMESGPMVEDSTSNARISHAMAIMAALPPEALDHAVRELDQIANLVSAIGKRAKTGTS